MIRIYSYIRKLPDGQWRVLSEEGRNLGTFSTEDAAKKRLKQVEYFKYLDKKKKRNKRKIAIRALGFSKFIRR